MRLSSCRSPSNRMITQSASLPMRVGAPMSKVQRLSPVAVSRLLAASISLLAFGCGSVTSQTPSIDKPPLPILAFDLPSLPSGRLNAAALRGRFVVLKPFAAWCSPCRNELPLLVEASSRFRDLPVTFIGVSFDKDRDAAKKLIDELRVPFPVAYDRDGILATSLALTALTRIYLFDPEGNLIVRYASCNPSSVEDLVQRLLRLTKDQPVTALGAASR